MEFLTQFQRDQLHRAMHSDDQALRGELLYLLASGAAKADRRAQRSGQSEDLIHSAWMILTEHCIETQGHRACCQLLGFFTQLETIARNTVANLRRRRQFRPVSDDLQAKPRVLDHLLSEQKRRESAPTPAEIQLVWNRVQSILDSLSPDDATIVRWSIETIHDVPLTAEDKAKLLGVSVATYYQRKSRAIARFMDEWNSTE